MLTIWVPKRRISCCQWREVTTWLFLETSWLDFKFRLVLKCICKCKCKCGICTCTCIWLPCGGCICTCICIWFIRIWICTWVLHLIKMHLIGFKCQTNANQMRLYYCCFVMVILLVAFVWNKPQEDQYKNPLIAVSESHNAHRDGNKAMREWRSCLECQRRSLVLPWPWRMASLSTYDLVSW